MVWDSPNNSNFGGDAVVADRPVMSALAAHRKKTAILSGAPKEIHRLFLVDGTEIDLKQMGIRHRARRAGWLSTSGRRLGLFPARPTPPLVDNQRGDYKGWQVWRLGVMVL